MPVFLGMAAGLKSGILDERSFLDLCQLVVSALAVASMSLSFVFPCINLFL